MRALSIVASIVVSLFFITSCEFGSKGEKENQRSNNSGDSSGSSSLSIAFVDMDSLINNLDMFLDMKAEFQDKASNVDANLNNRAKSFEKEATDFQYKVQNGLVTRAEAANLEQTLTKKQQDIMAYREKVMNDLSEEEGVMMRKIREAINVQIKEYNATAGYSLILSTASGVPILYGDKSFDITKDIKNEMNATYAKEKSNSPAK